jgi:hypothetical protein
MAAMAFLLLFEPHTTLCFDFSTGKTLFRELTEISWFVWYCQFELMGDFFFRYFLRSPHV